MSNESVWDNGKSHTNMDEVCLLFFYLHLVLLPWIQSHNLQNIFEVDLSLSTQSRITDSVQLSSFSAQPPPVQMPQTQSRSRVVTARLVPSAEKYWSHVPEDLVYNLEVLRSTAISKISNIVSPSDCWVAGRLSVSYKASVPRLGFCLPDGGMAHCGRSHLSERRGDFRRNTHLQNELFSCEELDHSGAITDCWNIALSENIHFAVFFIIIDGQMISQKVNRNIDLMCLFMFCC